MTFIISRNQQAVQGFPVNRSYTKGEADGKFAPIGGGAGTVTSVTSANANATVATQTTTPVITIVSAPKLSNSFQVKQIAWFYS